MVEAGDAGRALAEREGVVAGVDVVEPRVQLPRDDDLVRQLEAEDAGEELVAGLDVRHQEQHVAQALVAGDEAGARAGRDGTSRGRGAGPRSPRAGSPTGR